jgi:hypothetical protein
MKVLRRVACFFVGHRWRVEHNPVTQGTEQECLRCGAHRSAFPGATQSEPGRGRPYSEDGIGTQGGQNLGGGDGGGGGGW